MSCEDATARALKETGQRLTPQRLMVLSAVRHADGHITVAEIIEQVKVSYPYIDVSTVYRTLGALKEMRLITETDMGESESKYEWLEQERHHHLICRGCDRVTLLDHKHVKSLGAEILAGNEFQADLDHFAIFGLCQECRLKAESPAPATE